MYSDLWKTLFTTKFDNKYLYHYTNVDKGIKIICSNMLLFSPITRTNDTTEAKMKITFPAYSDMSQKEYTNITNKILNYFTDYRSIVRNMSFAMDSKISSKEISNAVKSMDPKDKFYDVLGRGFALPRMWAQYADNNEGICFIFDKEKLIMEVKKQVAFFMEAPVTYKKFSDRYVISKERANELNQKIDMVGNGGLTLISMIQNDRDFLQYNFFEKLDDWKNEHEYRIITLTDKADSAIYVKNLTSFLCGIVVGEKIDSNYEKIIRMLIKGNGSTCEIKKIAFNSNCCLLK